MIAMTYRLRNDWLRKRAALNAFKDIGLQVIICNRVERLGTYISTNAYDAFQASAREADAQKFCADWQLPREATFHISVYSEEGCFILATAWCHKLQWFYDKALADGFEMVTFGQGDLEAYPEPADVAELHDRGGARVRARISSLRALRPRRRS